MLAKTSVSEIRRYSVAVLILLTAVFLGIVWGMIHGKVWLQLEIPWMVRSARFSQGVRHQPNRRTEAISKGSVSPTTKLVFALFGTLATGGALAYSGAGWGCLGLYLFGGVAGFSPAPIRRYWPLLASIGALSTAGFVVLWMLRDTSAPGPEGGRNSPDSTIPEAVNGLSVASPDAPVHEQTGDRIDLPGVSFAFNDATLRPETLATLDLAVRILRDRETLSITIIGYSDAVGSESFNLRLSQARANAVRQYLITEGIGKERLRMVARGEDNPREPNVNKDGTDNPEGRAVNRRVELMAE